MNTMTDYEVMIKLDASDVQASKRWKSTENFHLPSENTRTECKNFQLHESPKFEEEINIQKV